MKKLNALAQSLHQREGQVENQVRLNENKTLRRASLEKLRKWVNLLREHDLTVRRTESYDNLHRTYLRHLT